MADQKPTNKERIKEIVAGIEQNIQELFQSERYFDYLRTMSRFHSYSVNNTLLIHMQRPHASQPVAGFRKWQQFGRHVKRGEKGLTIIAPTPLKKKIEEIKLDPDTKAPMLDQDGKIIMEEKTVEIPLFKPVKVFSADQTEGEPLPTLAAPLTGDVQQYEAFMEALRRTSPMPISFAPLEPGTDGLCSFSSQTISIREGMSEVQTVCATVHEIGHAVLHNRERDRLTSTAGTDKEPPTPKDNNTKEVEAESVSFAVCQYYGIDTSENSMGYIAGWSKDRSLPELKASLETITKTVSGLINTIDRHFAEICKERGIDLTAQPEQAAPAVELPDTPERFVSDMFTHVQEMYEAQLISDPLGSITRNEAETHYTKELSHGDFSGVHSFLDSVQEQAVTPTVQKLRNRLEKLEIEWDAGLSYEVKAYIPDSSIDRFYLEAHRQVEDGFRYNEVLFAGSKETCSDLLQKLEAKEITAGEVRAMEPEDWVAPQAPAASQPVAEDSIERFSADLYDYMAQLHQKGVLQHPFTQDDREQSIADLVQELHNGYFDGPLNTLMYISGHFAEESHAANDLLGRLDRLEEAAKCPTEEEALFVTDSAFLHIQVSDGGYDYTLYDKATMRQLDGGQVEMADMGGSPQERFRAAACLIVSGEPNVDGASLEFAPVGMINVLREAAERSAPEAAAESREQSPDPPEKLRDTTLDEYPMPDPDYTMADLEQSGYLDGDLLPLSQDRALELIDKDMTVYVICVDESPVMAFDREEIEARFPGTLFAVSREEWEESQDFQQAIADRRNHQEERESAFLNHSGDCFAIYQVRDDPALEDIRFESLEWIKSKGYTPKRENYDLIYTAPLPEADSVNAALDKLWYQFNNEHPADYQSPSASVSDIIAIKQDGVVSFHYCDSFGFQQLPDFIKPENYLKNAEMALEDDYGMIDGIINNGPKEGPTAAGLEAQVKAGQTISLFDLAAATHREHREKKSVMARLQQKPPQQEKKRKALKKSAEKER